MKNIWLIGASEGIGRELAIALARKGNFVIASARNKERLDELNSKIKKNILALPLDVTSSASVKNAFNLLKKTHHIDMIIYCAGYYTPMCTDKIDLSEAEKMIDINLSGAIRVLNYALPSLIKKKAGHIVLIGSVAGYRGLPNSFGYGASKAGLIHLAENLKCDLTRHGIKVQVINPGFVKTRLTSKNKFKMPFIISAKQAAEEILAKISTNQFESRFPFLFAGMLKFISKMPYWLYFKIIKVIQD